MTTLRELIALQIMKATQDRATPSNDFMMRLRLPLPRPMRRIPGAIGWDKHNGLARGHFSPNDLKLKCEMVNEWGIGSFDAKTDCSTIYDPRSPWYNTFYGSYSLLSYKPNRVPWGYSSSGQPNFTEIAKIYEIDYNFFVAWTLGAPGDRLSFEAVINPLGQHDGWDVAEMEATVPSMLHVPGTARNTPSYLVYGAPDLSLFLPGQQPYDPVKMIGRAYMRVVSRKPKEPPITVAWGALCPNTGDGNKLLKRIIDAFVNSKRTRRPTSRRARRR
jgi:hypothetical protein